MRVNGIDRENVNATKIHTNKYIEYVPNKTTITSMKKKWIDQFTSMKTAATESSRRRDCEP